MGAFQENSFNSVQVNIPRTTLMEWVQRRLESTLKWIEHKEKTLATMLENTTLTKATLESMLRGGGHGNYSVSNSARVGGVESHEQATLIALVARIEELKRGRRALLNIRAGLKAAVDGNLSVSLSMVASLQPGEENIDADDEADEENG